MLTRRVHHTKHILARLTDWVLLSRLLTTLSYNNLIAVRTEYVPRVPSLNFNYEKSNLWERNYKIGVTIAYNWFVVYDAVVG